MARIVRYVRAANVERVGDGDGGVEIVFGHVGDVGVRDTATAGSVKGGGLSY